MQKVGSWNFRPFLKTCALTFPLFNFPIHKQEVNHHQWRTYKVQCLYTQLWRSRNTNKSFSSTWLSQSSFKLLINWAVIMMCQWGWRGKNNLQVGEMRHEWLPSLTCAMLLVCVRSRQIPSVLSPFASVMGGWEHQLPPLPASSSSFVGNPTPYPQAASWKYKESMWLTLWGSRPGRWDICFNSQVPPTEQDMARESTPLHGRKGVRKSNFWVLLEQRPIMLCLPPPDLMHSWIIVCCPLHTFHNNSGYTFAALSRVAQENLTWLWNTSSPLRNSRAPFVTISFLSELLYLGSV